MSEQRRDTDEPRSDTDETREALTVPEAADRLGLSIDAVRMRIRRGTLSTAEINGKKLVLVPRSVTDETHHDNDETSAAQPPDNAELVDQLRSEIAYLRQTLDAEIEARRRADHLVAGMIDERGELTVQIASLTANERELETEHRRVADETQATEPPVDAIPAPTAGDRPAQVLERLSDRFRRWFGR